MKFAERYNHRILELANSQGSRDEDDELPSAGRHSDPNQNSNILRAIHLSYGVRWRIQSRIHPRPSKIQKGHVLVYHPVYHDDFELSDGTLVCQSSISSILLAIDLWLTLLPIHRPFTTFTTNPPTFYYLYYHLIEMLGPPSLPHREVLTYAHFFPRRPRSFLHVWDGLNGARCFPGLGELG